MLNWRGSMTALVTPFDRKGSFDRKAFESFIDWQIAEGTQGLVPVGTTGESPTLSHEEHHKVIEVAIKVASRRVPVIAGCGSNNTEEAISLARHAKQSGADAALIVTPYYNKPTQAGLYAHYAAIAKAVEIPIIIYNIPGRSVVDMSVATMARLAKDFPLICGVKDATGDLSRPLATRLALGDDFLQLSGEDPLIAAFLAQGGHGIISVVSNVFPRLSQQLQSAWVNLNQSGSPAEFIKARDALFPYSQAMFAFAAPTSTVKYALSRLGKCEATVRLPLVELEAEAKAKIDALLPKS